jgi:DNA-binding XRE family transcriptional regulator
LLDELWSLVMRSFQHALPAARAAQLDQLLQVERMAFAAKLRAARAVLGLSQDELAREIGMTQRSVHRIEQGSVQPKVRTILVIESFWRRRGIAFETLSDGGFRLIVDGAVLASLDDARERGTSSTN